MIYEAWRISRGGRSGDWVSEQRSEPENRPLVVGKGVGGRETGLQRLEFTVGSGVQPTRDVDYAYAFPIGLFMTRPRDEELRV